MDCWVRHKVGSQIKVRQVVVLFQHCPINVAAGELVSCHSFLSFLHFSVLKNRRLYTGHPTFISPPAPAHTTDIQKKMQKFTVAASHVVSACVNKIESQPTKLLFFVPFYYLNKPFLYICLCSKVQPCNPNSVTSPEHLREDGPVPASGSRGHTNTAGLSSHAPTLTYAGLPLPWVLRQRGSREGMKSGR